MFCNLLIGKLESFRNRSSNRVSWMTMRYMYHAIEVLGKLSGFDAGTQGSIPGLSRVRRLQPGLHRTGKSARAVAWCWRWENRMIPSRVQPEMVNFVRDPPRASGVCALLRQGGRLTSTAYVRGPHQKCQEISRIEIHRPIQIKDENRRSLYPHGGCHLCMDTIPASRAEVVGERVKTDADEYCAYSMITRFLFTLDSVFRFQYGE